MFSARDAGLVAEDAARSSNFSSNLSGRIPRTQALVIPPAHLAIEPQATRLMVQAAPRACRARQKPLRINAPGLFSWRHRFHAIAGVLDLRKVTLAVTRPSATAKSGRYCRARHVIPRDASLKAIRQAAPRKPVGDGAGWLAAAARQGRPSRALVVPSDAFDGRPSITASPVTTQRVNAPRFRLTLLPDAAGHWQRPAPAPQAAAPATPLRPPHTPPPPAAAPRRPAAARSIAARPASGRWHGSRRAG